MGRKVTLDVLMSIKPRFVKEIVSGEKVFEWRKSFILNKDVERIYIYSSYPVRKIIGYFTPDYVVRLPIEDLFSHCMREWLDMPVDVFYKYFENKDFGCAIKIKDVFLFDEPLNPYELEEFNPPRSYKVMGGELEEFINSKRL